MNVPLRAYTEPIGDCQPPGRDDHVQGVLDLYAENLRARNRAGDYSDGALESALGELRNFGAVFGPVDLERCRQHDLTRWLGLNPQWRSAGKKKRAVSTILTCFRWAADEELISHCPYHSPKSLKGLPDKARRPADASEYVTLMRFGSRPLRRALFCLRRVGIRTKEMRELIWPQVDLGKVPHICLDKHKTFRKTGKPRKIGLDAATANFLRALQRSQRGNTDLHVFTNCDGGPWTCHSFAQHLRRHAERLGLDDGVKERVSAYCLRHTYVCDGIEGGVTTRRIADQAGHSSTKVIDSSYGSHTRGRVEHLGDVATEILRKRKRNKPAAKSVDRRPGEFQGTLFDGPDATTVTE